MADTCNTRRLKNPRNICCFISSTDIHYILDFTPVIHSKTLYCPFHPLSRSNSMCRIRSPLKTPCRIFQKLFASVLVVLRNIQCRVIILHVAGVQEVNEFVVGLLEL